MIKKCEGICQKMKDDYLFRSTPNSGRRKQCKQCDYILEKKSKEVLNKKKRDEKEKQTITNIKKEKDEQKKKCSGCGFTLDFTFFNANKREKCHGLDKRCKICIENKRKENELVKIPVIRPFIDRKTCNDCGNEKLIDEFTKNINMKTGYRNDCRICHNLKIQEYKKTKKCFLIKLVGSSKGSAKTRKKEHTITNDDILYLADYQDDLCAISGLPLTYQRHSDWQCSLDRIDDSIGYIKENVRLITLEFNTEVKWSVDLIYTSINLMNLYVDYLQVLNDIINPIPKSNPLYKWVKQIIKEKEYVFCHLCKKLKTIDLFNIRFNNGCKICANSIKNFKQRFSLIYRNAKKHTRERNLTRNITQYFTITPEFLLELYKNQKGLCAISNIPLDFKDEYCVSIERSNTDIGYTPENVSLICVCFQSTQKQGGENASGGRWTKDKWQVIVDKFTEK
jgi:hypothetical protein